MGKSKTSLEEFRTRWRRWLGNKTRKNEPHWITLLDSNWVSWVQGVCYDAGLDYVSLAFTTPRDVIKARFLDAINHASMDDLYKLDEIYVTNKYGY